MCGALSPELLSEVLSMPLGLSWATLLPDAEEQGFIASPGQLGLFRALVPGQFGAKEFYRLQERVPHST